MIVRFRDHAAACAKQSWGWYMCAIYAALADRHQAQKQIGEDGTAILPRLVWLSMQLGAICREYQLSDAHKKTVTDRKKTNEMLANNYERDLLNAERRAQAEKWGAVARSIAVESHLTGAALEDKINRALIRQGFEKRSGRSIRRAISRK